MKIYRAVKTNLLTQTFGLKGTKVELIPLYNSLKPPLLAHDGFDWAVLCKANKVKHGGQCEAVYCDLDIKSTVIEISENDEFGFGIVAISEDKDGIFQHLWWHLDDISDDLKVGTVLESGDYLGIAGNTGRSTGAHLHRQIRPMARDVYGNLYKTQLNNGYNGAIDIEPYFENKFVLDVISGLQAQLGIIQQLVNLFKSLLKK